jgi:hypothetical protein
VRKRKRPEVAVVCLYCGQPISLGDPSQPFARWYHRDDKLLSIYCYPQTTAWPKTVELNGRRVPVSQSFTRSPLQSRRR